MLEGKDSWTNVQLVSNNIIEETDRTIIFYDEIENWDYEKSVLKTASLVKKFKKTSVELVRELYIAHEAFSHNGGDRYHSNSLTFADYCFAIGINRRTADRWLERFIPEENRLLDPEEIKAQKLEQKRLHDQQIIALVEEYARTSIFPEEWNEECQVLYDQLHEAKTMMDPLEEYEQQKQSWTHIFESKKKRKATFWNQRELDAWGTVEQEPIRSLAKQVGKEREVRTEVSTNLHQIEKIIAQYQDEEHADLRIALQNLQLKLEDFE